MEKYYERDLFDSKKIVLSRQFYHSIKDKRLLDAELYKNCIEKVVLVGDNKRKYTRQVEVHNEG